MFFDEVQTYDGASRGHLVSLLEQSAKYGLRAFLLNQNPERLTPQTLDAVMTNRSHLATAVINARAAAHTVFHQPEAPQQAVDFLGRPPRADVAGPDSRRAL